MKQYFKRYKMEVALRFAPYAATVPVGYQLLPWEENLLDAHAVAKHRSFRSEIDATVFPCLAEASGCRRLMGDITSKRGFVPDATWLAVYRNEDGSVEYCGTIQGIEDDFHRGGIQNLGVVPAHRGRGLGRSLLQHALIGFRLAGVRSVHLEVTATNLGAVRLYRENGFRHVKTVYKSVTTVPASQSVP